MCTDKLNITKPRSALPMTYNANQYSTIHQKANSILKRDIHDLQVIPSLAIKLLRLTSDNTNRAAELSALLVSEPALAEKVLSNVNSTVFSHDQKIKSFKQAIKILGDSEVRKIGIRYKF